jgi:hypothetical protein
MKKILFIILLLILIYLIFHLIDSILGTNYLKPVHYLFSQIKYLFHKKSSNSFDNLMDL